MKKTLVTLFFCFACFTSIAQSHNYKSCCRLNTTAKAIQDGCSCPGCYQEKQDEIKKSNELAKRQQEAAIAKKAADDAELKKAADERERNNKERNTITIEAPNSSGQDSNVMNKKTESEKAESEKKTEPEKKVVKQITDSEREAAKLEFERRQKESQAKALEAEGDKFYTLGSMFMDSALQSYNQAQNIYYSATVQAKIDKINGIKAAVTLVQDGMGKADEFLSDTQQTFDDAGWPRWRVSSFTYEALAPSFKGFETQQVNIPKAYSYSYGFYRLIALEVGFRYQESPVYKFGLEDNNGNYINKDIEASNTTLGPELLLGFGGGGKNIAFYVMYGYYFPFVLSGTPYTTGYEYRGDFKDAFEIRVISKLKAGFFYTIPKTNIGIGAYYCINGVNAEKLLAGGLVDVIDRSRGLEDTYGLGPGKNSSLDPLKYSSIGFSFIIKDR